VWETVAAIGWTHLLNIKYDEHYAKDVRFARHGMAIDEYRRDLVCVKWGGSGTFPDAREGEPFPFEQIWFAGNHQDIGGSYPENESRLSDIPLKWMADFIELELPLEGRVQVNRERLHCSPSSDGMMHDECMVGIAGTRVRWPHGDREVPKDAKYTNASRWIMYATLLATESISRRHSETTQRRRRISPMLCSHQSSLEGAPHLDSVSR
jgi:hypothetical protein